MIKTNVDVGFADMVSDALIGESNIGYEIISYLKNGGNLGGATELNNEYLQTKQLMEKQNETLNSKLSKRFGIDVFVNHGVGLNTKTNTWYGWSHRAICGFKMGDKVFEEGYGDDNTPFNKHGKKTIKTSADAKLAAQNFSKYVS